MESSIYFYTDCHFRESNSIEISKIASISRIVNNDHNQYIYFVFSGDIAFSGKSIEYEAFEEFVSEIRNQTNKNIEIIVCPGNHDINYQKEEEYTLDSLTNDTKKSNIVEAAKKRFSKMAAYYAFERKNVNYVKDDDYLSHLSFSCDEKEIIFYSLNNVLFSCFGSTNSSDSTRGYAYIPDKTIGKIKRNYPNQLVVLLMHFPIDYFSSDFGHEFKDRINTNVDLILNGHLHVNEESMFIGKGDVTVIQGTYFSDKGLTDKGGFTKIDLRNMDYCSFRWDDDSSYIEQFPKRKIYLNSSKRNSYGISFDDEYLNELTKCTILDDVFSIEDIFVFPNLQKEKYDDINEKNTFIKDFSSFCSKLKNKGVAFIYGDEGSGKTLLAKYLTLSLFNENFIPILCNGESLSKAKSLNSLVKRQINEMYHDSNLVKSKFDNEFSKNDKVLIIDDYYEYDNSALVEAKKIFGEIIVIAKSKQNSFIKKPKYIDGEVTMELSIQPMVKTKRREFTYKFHSALANSGKKASLDKEQFFSAVENQLESISFNDICDPLSLACIEIKAFQSIESFDNNMFSSVNQARSLLFLENVKNKYNSNYNLLSLKRIISNLAYSLYEQGIQEFSPEIITLAINEEMNNYGDSGITASNLSKIMIEALIVKELNNLNYSFVDRDVFSYYIAFYIHNQIEDGDYKAFTKLLSKDIFIPINFNIMMCISSIYDNKVIPNKIIDLVLNEAKNQPQLDASNFSINGITKEKQEELKRLTEDDIRIINERQDTVEKEKHDAYLINRDNLYYVESVPESVKDITTWLDKLKICCVLLKNFSGSLKIKYKEKLINLVISLPNIVLYKFNDYLFKELDDIYAALKENAPQESVVSNMMAFNNYIISIKRAFILSTYDYGARCFTDNASKDILKTIINKPNSELVMTQKLMFESFTVRGDGFVNSCSSIINNKEIKDNSFIKSAARLIGRRYIAENFELCNSKYKSFVNLIFNSPKEALQYKAIEERKMK